jgi:hypothetical protein
MSTSWDSEAYSIERRIHELIYDFSVFKDHMDSRWCRRIILVQMDSRNYLYANSGEGLLVI